LRANAFQKGDNDVDIQAQLHKVHDKKTQAHKRKMNSRIQFKT